MGSHSLRKCCGFRIRRAKIAQKNRKQFINYIFGSAGCSRLRAEGFFCRLDVLYEGLEINKFRFLILKRYIKIFRVPFFPSIFGHQTPGSVPGSGFT
jgi:hypothetical protein